MSSIQILGSYVLDTQALSVSGDEIKWVNENRLLQLCENISKNKIDDLTIEFDEEFFINFRIDKVAIRFVGGPLAEFGYLHNSLFNGELVEEVASTSSEETSVGLNSTPNDEEIEHEIQDESALIHNSLLPQLNHFKKAFSKAEVFFKPFESPGGDFYWVKNYQYKSVIIVGDCTGHGIQGAMIAMSVITLLKQYFKLPPVGSIKTSLVEFYDSLKGLMEEQDLNIFDVELGIILKDHRKNSAEYIGSGVNLIVKSEKECQPYTSRKAHVIKGRQEAYQFTLNKGDQMFLFSDGITDQFDSDNKRKLGMKALVSIIEDLSLKGTIQEFQESFKNFRGSTSSLDDQTMLILTT